MKQRRLVLKVFGVLWLFAIIAGLWIMLDYENSPGSAATPPVRWPAASEIRRAPGRATLVVLAHPHCPCTRATLGELAMLMTRLQGQVSAYVLFYRPAGFGADWEKANLWRAAAAIPGVRVMSDVDGVEAARFRAAVSGQTILYDANGRLVFSGGITSARGHSGDNAGRNAIVQFVTSGVTDQAQTSVFGCFLHDPNTLTRQAGQPWRR